MGRLPSSSLGLFFASSFGNQLIIQVCLQHIESRELHTKLPMQVQHRVIEFKIFTSLQLPHWVQPDCPCRGVRRLNSRRSPCLELIARRPFLLEAQVSSPYRQKSFFLIAQDTGLRQWLRRIIPDENPRRIHKFIDD